VRIDPFSKSTAISQIVFHPRHGRLENRHDLGLGDEFAHRCGYPLLRRRHFFGHRFGDRLVGRRVGFYALGSFGDVAHAGADGVDLWHRGLGAGLVVNAFEDARHDIEVAHHLLAEALRRVAAAAAGEDDRRQKDDPRGYFFHRSILTSLCADSECPRL